MSEEKEPWELKILAAMERIEALLERLVEQSETKKKLSEAGKRSAEARKAKFGSAQPSLSLITPEGVREQVREKKKTLEGVREQVRRFEPSVWDAYVTAYRVRYPVVPLRNVKVNSQCKALERELGVGNARELAAYYLTRNDAFYVHAKHPIGLCLRDAQKLWVERCNGEVVTMTDARRLERDSQNARLCQEYLRSEHLREQVRENSDE